MADTARQEAIDYIALAAKLGSSFVRVLADKDPAPGFVDEDAVLESLRVLLPLAEKRGVTLLIEPNGIYGDSERLAALVCKLPGTAVGVLWDVHHPFSYFGESPAKTYANLSRYIRHVHIKDSVMVNGKPQYKMTGNGDVPIKEVVRLLTESNFGGFVSLEWVRRWDTGLENPGIVLPHFLSVMKKK